MFEQQAQARAVEKDESAEPEQLPKAELAAVEGFRAVHVGDTERDLPHRAETESHTTFPHQ
jgi:hypothetical protein